MRFRDELLLMNYNFNVLWKSSRVGRIPYACGIVGIILNKAMILVFLGFQYIYDERYLTLYRYEYGAALWGGSLLLQYILVNRRLNDIGISKWNILIIITAYILLFIYWGGNLSILAVTNSIEYHILNPLSGEIPQLFILLFLALPPSDSANNEYGLSMGKNIFNGQVIYYEKQSISTRWFNLNGIFESMWDVLFLNLFNFKGRSSIRTLILGIIGVKLFISVLIFLIIAVLKFLADLRIEAIHMLPFGAAFLIYSWPLMGCISLFVRRLHDCLLSGLWIVGILIPFINIYVFYHLLFKPSWKLDIKV